MTIDEFISWIIERHPDLTQMGEDEIRQNFGEYDGESLDKVKEVIIAKYRNKTAPRVAIIKEMTAGITLKKERGGTDQNYAYLCKKCHTFYRGRINFYDAYKCPVCGERTGDHPLVKNPQGRVIFVQVPCVGSWDGYVQGHEQEDEDTKGTCPWFNGSYQDNTGPACESYGHFGSLMKCQECRCRGCCEAFTREREEMLP